MYCVKGILVYVIFVFTLKKKKKIFFQSPFKVLRYENTVNLYNFTKGTLYKIIEEGVVQKEKSWLFTIQRQRETA